MAYYQHTAPSDAGFLNSVFTVAVIAGLLAFAIAATYIVG
jgi:hypothetical protein